MGFGGHEGDTEAALLSTPGLKPFVPFGLALFLFDLPLLIVEHLEQLRLGERSPLRGDPSHPPVEVTELLLSNLIVEVVLALG